jgi:hypothetical protein
MKNEHGVTKKLIRELDKILDMKDPKTGKSRRQVADKVRKKFGFK